MCVIVDNIHKVMCEVGRLGNNLSSRMALFMNVMYDCLCYAPALDPMRTTNMPEFEFPVHFLLTRYGVQALSSKI